ncbi:hypothetical protein N7495_004364 [Penicillium taxi]|uniref:uncharacterized protein n=1 Tax=Penicillium taxi TaxID=168475 RepID=UPI0025454829|nr:uncharacterized protein N7495_004364 [Penicillium taxi]KAJ5899620.1 hypothetical protein N7495_004364 [Penicillium taxi]
MSDLDTVSLNALSLGAHITGRLEKESDIALFQGIPYATVNKRWTHSETRHSLDKDFDATKHGYRCSQPNRTVLVTGGTPDPSPGDDEFRCLNLNIAVPTTALNNTTSKPLPVLVWIHGGGFAFGANSVARYRPQALLNHARENGTPVILVSINYRLGHIGFAASQDLDDELDGGSRSHPVGSFGLIDQRNGLEWVNKHIADFGGDPSNITAFGVSAGSMSIHLHLVAGHNLFDRAILMSGSGPILSPLQKDLFQREWDRLCQRTGVQASTSSDRLAQLRALSVQDILNNTGSAAMGPVADGKLLSLGWKYEDSVTDTRCKEIILGDTSVEGIIFDGRLKKLPQALFHKRIDEAFSPQVAGELYARFGFTREPQSEEDFRKAFRLFIGNTLFNYHNVGIANASINSDVWRDHVYLYHWDEPSPFPGPAQGLSYHGLCAILMHLNELSNCPPETQKVALESAKIWAAFAHGKQPWEPYSQSRKFMRFGPLGESSLQSFASDTARDYGFQDWLGAHIYEVGPFVRNLIVNLEIDD